MQLVWSAKRLRFELCNPVSRSNVSLKSVAEALFHVISNGEILKELQTDHVHYIPFVLVTKPHGMICFCLDVSEFMDQLGTVCFYLTLNLIKGYWQIPLSPKSKEENDFLHIIWFTLIFHSWVWAVQAQDSIVLMCKCCSLLR